MKTKDLVTISSVALTTATLTCLTFWSGSLEAGGEADALATPIAQPKLVQNGIELTLAPAGGQALAPGAEPSFQLTAVNTTDKPATATVRVDMTTSSPRDMLSRVPRIPAAIWQQQEFLTLQPNETRTLQLAADKKLPANQIVSVNLQAVEQEGSSTANTPGVAPQKAVPRRIEALSFSTASGQSQTSLLAVKK